MAAAFFRIVQGFWADPDVRRLTEREKYLLLYLFTSPHANMVGLYYLPPAYITQDTRIKGDELPALLHALGHFATYDVLTNEVLVHKTARYQIADGLSINDRRVSGIINILKAAQSPALVKRFGELYSDWPINVEPRKGVVPSAEKPSDNGESGTVPVEGPVEKPTPPAPDLTKPVLRRRNKPEIHQGWAEARDAYPRREGSHRWDAAEGFYGVSIKKGVTPGEILKAVKRYSDYCRKKGIFGSDKVMQAATFFNKVWKEWVEEPQLTVVQGGPPPVDLDKLRQLRLLQNRLQAGHLSRNEFEEQAKGLGAGRDPSSA